MPVHYTVDIAMAVKRSHTDAELQPISTRRTEQKRVRLPASADICSNSSEATAASDASALQSSTFSSEETGETSVSEASSIESEDESSDTSSEGSSNLNDALSDDSEADDEQEEADVVTIGGPKKPSIILPDQLRAETKKLYDKLQEFLPKLRQANGILTESAAKINMEDVDENEQHIEMDLGLGVLEERRDQQEVEEHVEHDTEESGEDESDVMRDLLGIKASSSADRKPAVQELADATST